MDNTEFDKDKPTPDDVCVVCHVEYRYRQGESWMRTDTSDEWLCSEDCATHFAFN
jgi:hypothetical protein